MCVCVCVSGCCVRVHVYIAYMCQLECSIHADSNGASVSWGRNEMSSWGLHHCDQHELSIPMVFILLLVEF